MVPRFISSSMWLLPALLSLAACSSEPAAPPQRESDPLLTRALNAPITIDPDLAAMNRANSIISLPPEGGYLPTIDNHAAAIAAARADAESFVGGRGVVRRVPVAGERAPAVLFAAAERAAGGTSTCLQQVRYTAHWAARMPPAFPVYPRAAVQGAAGTDDAGCALRVINFVTPVPLGEVIAFYYTSGQAAGFSAERGLEDGDEVLTGVKGNAAYIVYARHLPTGNTEVDLITSG